MVNDMKRTAKEITKIRILEIRRAFHSRGMVLALIIGCILAFAHVIQYQIIPFYLDGGIVTLEYSEFSKIRTVTPPCVADTWLAGNSANWVSFVYFLLLPILAMLPFGVSYFSDRESGYLKSVYTRMPRKQYLMNKYLATFLSGGVAVTIPLILNLLCTMVLLPNLNPSVVLPRNGIGATCLFYELYFSHPLLYTWIFVGIDFLLGGMFACVALSASYLSDYKVIVGIVPFFLQLGIHILVTMLGKIDYSSVFFAQAGYGLKHWWVFIVYVLAGVVISRLIFCRKGEKEDVF